ncbi:MAG: FAD-binding domain-containing protein [Paracoccaceae bacterium]|nr:FAD-binding domain-containing protein [Paracoccaceae bacterium]
MVKFSHVGDPRVVCLVSAVVGLARHWLAFGPAFIDYEPGIHWPQIQMQSGTSGINKIRIYNPVKQGLDQDPDGVFTRR